MSTTDIILRGLRDHHTLPSGDHTVALDLDVTTDERRAAGLDEPHRQTLFVPTIGGIQTVELYHGMCSYKHAASKVFGHLLGLGDGFVEHYRSDYFHDAVWLDKVLPAGDPFENPNDTLLNQPFVFGFRVRKFGTNIGQDLSTVGHDLDKTGDERGYVVQLRREGRYFSTMLLDVVQVDDQRFAMPTGHCESLANAGLEQVSVTS